MSSPLDLPGFVLHVSPKILQQAKNWTDFVKNNRTIKQEKNKADDDLTGALGEIAFQQLCPSAERISDNDFEADFVALKKRVDVKTKKRKGRMLPEWEVSVALYDKDKNCDQYAFYNYSTDEQVVEFLGIIDKSDFWNNATILQEGDFDPSNAFFCRKQCANLTFKELHKIIKLKFIQQLNPNPMSNYTPQPNTFSLFANDKGDNPKRPDYKGDIILPDGTKMRLSAWIRESANGGRKFLSGKVEPMQERQESAPAVQAEGDDLPF